MCTHLVGQTQHWQQTTLPVPETKQGVGRRMEGGPVLLVSPSCLEFAAGLVKAFLHPRPGYVPKFPTNVERSIVLQAYCSLPFQTLMKYFMYPIENNCIISLLTI